ncbi:TPA: hypothetical protein L3M66_004903 [Vibrio parahaemolyticus]|nr:hypothetical protein [Vibrio parahaemolyticus]
MHSESIRKQTDIVNQLLNQPNVLLPIGHQFRWANEYDSMSELWLICSSFISDINYALTDKNAIQRLGKLESQINYGGVFIDEYFPQSTSIQLNNDIINDEWLSQLRDAIGAIYIQVCPLHSHSDSLSFYSESIHSNSFTLALAMNQIKMQLQLPELSLFLDPYAYHYKSTVSEHGLWVSSISLIIALEKWLYSFDKKPQTIPIKTEALTTYAEKTRHHLQHLYTLTAPFFVINGRIMKDFGFQ